MGWFEDYLGEFEKTVASAVTQKLMGIPKQVPIGSGRLGRRRIGKTMGVEVMVEEVLAIDYYGYMKKSSGFASAAKEVMKEAHGKQLKLLEVPVVHFNSIRLEMLARLNPKLVENFGEFKKAVLDAREFTHNYKA